MLNGCLVVLSRYDASRNTGHGQKAVQGLCDTLEASLESTKKARPADGSLSKDHYRRQAGLLKQNTA